MVVKTFYLIKRIIERFNKENFTKHGVMFGLKNGNAEWEKNIGRKKISKKSGSRSDARPSTSLCGINNGCLNNQIILESENIRPSYA